MALSEEEKALATQASYGSDIMKQREAAVRLEDIRYEEQGANEDTGSMKPAEFSGIEIDSLGYNPGLADEGIDIDSLGNDGGGIDIDSLGEKKVEVKIDPEVRKWLPKTLEVGFGKYTFDTGMPLTDEHAAYVVGLVHGLTNIYRGARQAVAEYTGDQNTLNYLASTDKAVDRLYADEGLKDSVATGEIIGTLAEPVGFLLPGGKAATVGKAMAKGAAIGGGYGGLMYVKEGDTRAGNALLGGTIGAGFNSIVHGAQTYFANKGVQKARNNIDLYEKYIAEEIVKDPNAAIKASQAAQAAGKPGILGGDKSVYLRRARDRMPSNWSPINDQKLGRTVNAPRNVDEAKSLLEYYKGYKNPPSAIKQMDEAFGMLITRIGEHSPKLQAALSLHEFNSKIVPHRLYDRTTPFLETLSKLRGSQQEAFSNHLASGNFAAIDAEVQKMGPRAQKAWAETTKVLEELGDEALSLGIIKEKVPNYFPRYVTDVDGLIKAIGKEEGLVVKGAVEAALNSAEARLNKLGQKLSTEAKSEIIHRTIFGSRSTKAPRTSFSFQRRFKTVPPYLTKFYAKPEESLHMYIANLTNDINKRKFFGKNLKTLEVSDGVLVPDINKSVVSFLEKEYPDLTGTQRNELFGMLHARFGPGEQSPIAMFQTAKDLVYSMLIANPVSAATQLSDIGSSIVFNGWRNSFTGFLRSARAPGTEKTLLKGISTKDWGVLDHMAVEFAKTHSRAKLMRRIFKLSGFTYVDRLGKDTFVNAARSRMMKMSEGAFLKEFGASLGEAEAKAAYKNIQSGVIDDTFKYLLFSKLLEVQPISMSSVPQKYLENPNSWRMLYTLKTFMLAQVNAIRLTAWHEAKKGNYGKALYNLARYSTIMGAAGMGSADLKQRLLNTEPEHEWWNKAERGQYGQAAKSLATEIGLNLFKTFGWSEYYADKLERGEVAGTLVEQFAFPYEVFDKAIKLDPEAIPLYGKPFKYWFMGGAEEYEKKQQEKKLQKAREPITDLRKELKDIRER